ncbi:hypothetical protein D3C71_2080610 [compost metagenome]
MGKIHLGGFPQCRIQKMLVMAASMGDEHLVADKFQKALQPVDEIRSPARHFIGDPG